MSATPASPYKGLAAFDDSELDALFFFGRESDREAIVSNLLAGRLTVLYGPSGVGKSSLVRAGVAQRLRALGGAAVIVHDAWAEDPVGGIVASVREACPELGPTAGLVDAVAAAAQQAGEAYLLLDQFEEYFLYHGADGPLGEALQDLLRRPGPRVNVLIALRSDSLAELDALTTRVPGLYDNLLRLDRLDRRAGRAAIVGPLERYGELAGASYGAEPELIEAVLDEVAAGRVDFSGAAEGSVERDRVEAPYLQLVLERLWSEESAAGSNELRLETLRRLGGAQPIVRDHVYGTLDRLTPANRTRRPPSCASSSRLPERRSRRPPPISPSTRASTRRRSVRCSRRSCASASCAAWTASTEDRRATRSSTTFSPSRCWHGGRGTSSSASA